MSSSHSAQSHGSRIGQLHCSLKVTPIDWIYPNNRYGPDGAPLIVK